MFAKVKALNENKTSKQLERVARLKKKSVFKDRLIEASKMNTNLVNSDGRPK